MGIFLSRLRPAYRAAVCFTAMSVALVPATSWAHTINEALADAYRSSGLIEQNRAVLRAADEDVAQAVSALRPVLDYSLSASYVGGPGAVNSVGNSIEGTSYTLSLTSSMTLFDFGNNFLAVEVQKELVLAARQNLISVEQNALQLAANAFFDVLEAEAFVDLRENNVRLLTEELRAAEDRFEVGEVTRTDVAQAESRLAGARSNLASANGDLIIAQAAYLEATGDVAHQFTQPTSFPSIPGSVDAALAIARRTHPDILSVQRQIKANELNLERARLDLYPSLSGNLSSSVDLEGDGGRSDSIGLTFSGPISRGGRLNSLIREARAVVDQSRANLRLTVQEIEEEVRVAYAQLDAARANLVSSEEQIRAATVAFNGIREEATLGARTTLDVLDAEQELLDAQANEVSAVTTEFQAIYRILSAIGRLTARNLGLPVQLYDPAEYYNLVKDAPQSYSPQGEALDRVLQSLQRN